MILKQIALAAIAAAFLSLPALAGPPPQPAPVSVLAGQTTISATNSSSRVALPSTSVSAISVTIYNAGTKDAYFAQGGSSVVATTSSTLIKAGTNITLWISGTYIAAITGGSDTTSLVIYQANGPIQLSSLGGGGGGGGGTPGGSTTQVQYNDAGAFGGISGATTDGTALTVASGDFKLSGSGSGTTTLNAPATGGGTLGLPSGDDTLAGLAQDQTFTGTNEFGGGEIILYNSGQAQFGLSVYAGGHFTAGATAASEFNLSSNGTNYGQITNIDNDTWGLGWGSSASTIGTSVLTWTDNGPISFLAPLVTNSTSLPTTDPAVVGQLWNHLGIVTVSAGP